jgi:hypothetical protein
VEASLPKGIEKVFFRADSGFFSGKLFDLLEGYRWDYLVKVKLKGLAKLLAAQKWTARGNGEIAVCEFGYRAKGWGRTRTLKAVRTVKEYVEVPFLGGTQTVPVYRYACYIGTYDMDAAGLHEIYRQRSTSETWIEQVKGHTMAGGTVTQDFWANDILWQLAVLAYNISVMVRGKRERFMRQEYRTFMDWFVAVPARITRSGRRTELKMYERHFHWDDWEELDRLLAAA